LKQFFARASVFDCACWCAASQSLPPCEEFPESEFDMRVRVLSVIALLTLVWPASAQAGTILIDTFFQGYGAGVFVAGHAESFEIGSVQMSGGVGLGSSLDAPAAFEAYCVDFFTTVYSSGDHPDLPDPPGAKYDATVGSMVDWVDGGGLTANGSGARAAALYEKWVPTFDTDATSDLGRRQRAALQMAIWNALYDDDLTVLKTATTGGSVYFTEDNHNLTELADMYLASLLVNASGDASWLQLSFTNPDTQKLTDVQDFMGPKSVPEPGSLLLLGTGLAALTAFRRKSLRG
jgi:hypothetical protein